MKLPAELKPGDVTALIDTREQTPYDLSPLQQTTGTLTTGDYSVVGLSHVVAIERKSLDDLLRCVGKDRARFDREVQRLLAYPCRAVVVEASWCDLQAGVWRSQVKPPAVLGSVLGWIASGLPIIPCGNRAEAQNTTGRLLFIAARRRWRESRALLQAVTAATVD